MDPWVVAVGTLLVVVVLLQRRITELEERADRAIPWERMDALLDRAQSDTPAELHRRRVDELRRERMSAVEETPTVGPGGPGSPAARREALTAPKPGRDLRGHPYASVPSLARYDDVVAGPEQRAAGVARLYTFDGNNRVEEMPIETFDRLCREAGVAVG